MERLTGGVLFALGLLTALCVASAFVQASRAVRWRPRRLTCAWMPGDETDLPEARTDHC
jgi:hypothetical protein